MATKYIVNNVSGQTINGDVTINGNLMVTGVTTGSLLTYKALLTQTGPIVGTNINNFNGGLVIGETYTITSFSGGDDFSNISNVVTGTINQTGCEFIATGDTPANWSNSSELTSEGGLVVTVLENNLGFDLYWYMNPIGGSGTYVAHNNQFGPTYNTFDRSKTTITSQLTTYGPPFSNQLFCGPFSLTTKDDIAALGVWDFNFGEGVDNSLYYTPIEINIKQDLDTTPVVVSGSVISIYPFGFASVTLICNGNNVENFYGDNVTVNNLSELIAELNANVETSYLGTYSDDGSGGVLLTIATNKVNQFCSNGTLTFEVFAD